MEWEGLLCIMLLRIIWCACCVCIQTVSVKRSRVNKKDRGDEIHISFASKDFVIKLRGFKFRMQEKRTGDCVSAVSFTTRNGFGFSIQGASVEEDRVEEIRYLGGV